MEQIMNYVNQIIKQVQKTEEEMKKIRCINIEINENEIKEAIKEYLENRGIEAETENIYVTPAITIDNGLSMEMRPTQCYVESAKEHVN